ncbi:hypothetical protein VE03_10631, partial [Pseudogymnoascus sp. 23342-1-I1]
MQNTTPIPVPDGNTGSSGFTSTFSGFKTWTPRDDPPWRNPAETIIEAVRAGDLAKVTSLVADESYSPDEYLERALIAAVKEDQLEIGRYLLDHGAMIEKPVLRIRTGSYAVMEKSLPFFKLFVERGWDVNYVELGRTALFNVIQNHEF